jgi:hypothetical protein
VFDVCFHKFHSFIFAASLWLGSHFLKAQAKRPRHSPSFRLLSEQLHIIKSADAYQLFIWTILDQIRPKRAISDQNAKFCRVPPEIAQMNAHAALSPKMAP